MTARESTRGEHSPSDAVRSCVALWARAERQLYPLIMSSPDTYERAITVVRAVADRLRAETTMEGLARAFTESASTEPGSLALSAARDTGTPIDDLDAGVVASAGFGLRHQEIAAGRGRKGQQRHEPG